MAPGSDVRAGSPFGRGVGGGDADTLFRRLFCKLSLHAEQVPRDRKAVVCPRSSFSTPSSDTFPKQREPLPLAPPHHPPKGRGVAGSEKGPLASAQTPARLPGQPRPLPAAPFTSAGSS